MLRGHCTWELDAKNAVETESNGWGSCRHDVKNVEKAGLKGLNTCVLHATNGVVMEARE